MSKYYFLKVKEITRETPDTVSIHFWHPQNELVKYRPGQFLTVLLPGEGDKKIRRSYSMSSSPYTDVSLAITVKKFPGGAGSGFLADQVREGDVLEVLEPMGTFGLEPDPEQSRHLFLICAGSGITPIISIAKSVLIVEPESKVTLLDGNRTVTDIIFKDKLEALQSKYGSRFKVIHTLTQPPAGWAGETGRISKAGVLGMLEGYTPSVIAEAQFYLCGPDEMMAEARRALEAAGARNIFYESFNTTPKPAGDKPDENPDEKQVRTILLRYEGQEYQLRVPPHQSILEAAQEQDIDLPYSCQAGMCTACLGRKLAGEVRLDEYDALTEAEVKEGFILTCVAHPESDDVIVEVD